MTTTTNNNNEESKTMTDKRDDIDIESPFSGLKAAIHRHYLGDDWHHYTPHKITTQIMRDALYELLELRTPPVPPKEDEWLDHHVRDELPTEAAVIARVKDLLATPWDLTPSNEDIGKGER